MATVTGQVLAALGVAAIGAGALVGCAAPDETPVASAVDLSCRELITFVVAVDRANQAPGVNSALAGLIDQGIASGAAFTLVESDGKPSIVASGYRPHINNSNPDALGKDTANAKKTIMASIAGMKADSDGNDTLGAASLAADAATSAGVGCNTLVIIGAGNSDRGELDITAPGVVSASGDEVAASLTARRALPRFGAARTDVVLAGTGYTAADSAQPPLRQADRDNLTEIYTKVFKAAGATTVTDLRVPRTGNGPTTEYTVNPIPVAAATPMNFCGTTVFDNASQLGFFEGSAEFRDKDAARATLTEFGERLGRDSNRRIEIVGTTANWGSAEYKQELSRTRATAAADLIVAGGASRDQVTARGVGSAFPEYNPGEWLPDGSLDPVIANTNRSVRITVTSPPAGC
jgi:outer membrane protein OmpA-like peptidoglycan-associated protein